MELVLFFGSSNPDFIHCDLTNIEIIQAPCDKANCWHYPSGTEGKRCVYKDTEKYLQCTKSDSDIVINAVYRLINIK